MVDTDASFSGVHEEVFTELGVQPVNLIKTCTPHGERQSFVYVAAVSFPALHLSGIPVVAVGCNRKWTTATGKDVIMLIGRDLLNGCLFAYNGKFSSVTLAY
jgi:hypothetical protein